MASAQGQNQGEPPLRVRSTGVTQRWGKDGGRYLPHLGPFPSRAFPSPYVSSKQLPAIAWPRSRHTAHGTRKPVTVIPYCSPQNASPMFSSPGQLLGVFQGGGKGPSNIETQESSTRIPFQFRKNKGIFQAMNRSQGWIRGAPSTNAPHFASISLRR
jgi:hypothetical protein